ncbi:extracellular catalytic domain type 1 short-chain-length polyhydroxyalkanoate depolymerase [Pseudoduganella sp. OTU4001]|uniref:extracellular catalytic domain type 1 short-chain-length polyhydroxyalkanoate depolymerase n=1 Tax=Pseudoduganella sp. OTU4001 TaxID=3043854 RepID=UPI00313A93E5
MKNVVLGFVLLIASVAASAAQLSEVTSFGSNPGNLRLFQYVPSNRAANAPLVVVAHGCSQTAQEFATQSGWLTLAEQHGFAVAFPQTSTANEPLAGCFRTWYPAHQERGAGEPQSVKSMIDYMRTTYGLGAVYMSGLSGGGHLTNIMLATYPDVLSAGAPMSSYPYKCATSSDHLADCAGAQRNFTAQQWGDLARSGYPGYNGVRPRVMIWHGSYDDLIFLPNQYLQVVQWTNAMGIDAAYDWTDYLLGHVRNSYNNYFGVTRVQTVTVQYMGHAIAVDPGFGAWQCGATGTYASDFNICAAYWAASFFGIL